jgi:hypothetical protein
LAGLVGLAGGFFVSSVIFVLDIFVVSLPSLRKLNLIQDDEKIM